MASNNPILNNPYEEPRLHYGTDMDGNLDYGRICEGRRPYTANIDIVPRSVRQGTVFSSADFLDEDVNARFINSIRDEVKRWRTGGYQRVTRITRELLTYWFCNSDRQPQMRLFFCQREAVETAVYLNEVAPADPNTGRYILAQLEERQRSMSTDAVSVLPRTAFKMATGTGKTVVMAMLILYNYLNKREYPQDTRFVDHFLLVAPGITIRDRLGVLYLEGGKGNRYDRRDYYHQRDLIPQQFESRLGGLNACITIVNYQQLEPRTLQGKHASPLDGKIIYVDGEAKKQEAKEDFSTLFSRILNGIKRGKRIVVINDEAHHCYLPRTADKPRKGAKDEETEEGEAENEHAMVWFEGLRQLRLRGIRLEHVYDLSATPYYLRGSGYPEYSLFPWVVSDFGLVDAIESGLVKIPFLPSFDNSADLQQPKLRNIYAEIRDELPKKGQKAQRKADREAGKTPTGELPPNLPTLLTTALQQFAEKYVEYEHGMREEAEAEKNLLTTPPVFIVVCNNTTVSKEVFKWLAGYESVNAEGHLIYIKGHIDAFSNYDDAGMPRTHRPSLLIDSASLDGAADIVTDEFKRLYAAEIGAYRREYAELHGAGAADALTEADILREVVNTVGKPGKLGAHIRCVVSVSMLTEGWDANTVTHIVGVRAFGSQLLCEQVVGRALRRRSYDLVPYNREGEEIPQRDIHKYKADNIIYKFSPEYAHVIGVPFKTFRGGKSTPPPTQKPKTIIRALDEREALEIRFPNVVGYRTDLTRTELKAHFDELPPFIMDFTRVPTQTTLQTAFSEAQELMELHYNNIRDQYVVYIITSALIRRYFNTPEHGAEVNLFGGLRDIVQQWYDHHIQIIGGDGNVEQRRLILNWKEEEICAHIKSAIDDANTQEEDIRPVLNFYNPEGSTAYVFGATSQAVYPTAKSHVNYVVADTDSWEQRAAKVLEETVAVEAYVKNAFLHFEIPYVVGTKQHSYIPDFIARIRTTKGELAHLIIEISGFSGDRNGHKAEKRLYAERYWLPAVHNLRDGDGCPRYGRWAFLEVSDIDNFRSILNQKIQQL